MSSPNYSAPLDTGKIGIITVLFHSEPVLPEFFASIAAQTYDNIVVFAIDNASEDRSAAMCREQGERYIVILNEENRGIAAANNQGITAALAAGCEYILLLNNDVLFGPELLSQLAEGVRTLSCEMTTPIMYFYDAPDVIWCAGGTFSRLLGERPRHYSEGRLDIGKLTQIQQVEFTPTCCVLIHRDVFARIGIMDEHYFIYWDDTDFMLRARQAGVRLWLLPHAKLWHKVAALTSRQGDFALRYGTRNHAYFLRKHLPLPLAMAWWCIYCIAYAVVAPFSTRSRVQLQSWIAGLRMPLP